MSLRLGYNIATPHSDVSPIELFSGIVDQAHAAERGGFDVVTVSDHLYQPPFVGPPDGPTLEAYTTLAALAASTSSIQLSAIVSSNTFRNPALLAKTVTSLDVISSGRAVLGIGAGWFELEHTGYGLEYGRPAERMDRLEESLQIIVPMLRGRRPTVAGRWYQAQSAINEPRVRDDLPVLVGGSGERRTFACAARYADHLNILCPPEELPNKLSAVRARCSEAGRDPHTLKISYAAAMVLDNDSGRAHRRFREMLLRSGVDIAAPPAERAAIRDRYFVGDPTEITEQLRTKVIDHGVHRLMINLVAGGQDPDVIELAGRTLAPLVADD